MELKYPRVFDTSKLEFEFRILCSHTNIIVKDLPDILVSFNDFQAPDMFIEIKRLITLVLFIPFSIETAERTFFIKRYYKLYKKCSITR